jgi:hypothetical protein
MTFLLLFLLTNGALHAMDGKNLKDNFFEISLEAPDHQDDSECDWLDDLAVEPIPTKNEDMAKEPAVKKIKRNRAKHKKIAPEYRIEIVRQNIYRLGGLPQTVSPETAQSLFNPQFIDGMRYLYCPVCQYKITSCGSKYKLKQQLQGHLEKGKWHCINTNLPLAPEWLKHLVLPLYDTMCTKWTFKEESTPEKCEDVLLKKEKCENPK